MKSKLKILVNYPCSVFCDFEFKGLAEPDALFFLELRKGRYILELKEGNYILYSNEYFMSSNDEEDLLKVDISFTLRIEEIEIPKTGINRVNPIDRGPNIIDNARIFANDINVSQFSFSEFRYKGFELVLPRKVNKLTFEFESYHYCDDDKSMPSIERFDFLLPKVQDPFLIAQLDFFWIEEDAKRTLCLYIKDKIYINTVYKCFKSSLGSFDRHEILEVINYGFLVSLNYGIGIFINKQSKWGLINTRDNSVIIDFLYDEIFNYCQFHDELLKVCCVEESFIVRMRDKYGKISKSGKILIPVMYDAIYDDNVELDGKMGRFHESPSGPIEWYDEVFIYDIIDNGSVEKNYFGRADCKILLYKLGDNLGFWDFKGQKHPAIYEEIHTEDIRLRSGDYYAIVKSNARFGIINTYGLPILSCVYDKIIKYENNDYVDVFNDIYFFLETGLEPENFSGIKKRLEDDGYSLDFLDRRKFEPYIDDKLMVFAQIEGKIGIVGFMDQILIPFEYESVEKAEEAYWNMKYGNG